MTAGGVILLVFYSYGVFQFGMETFDLEMAILNSRRNGSQSVVIFLILIHHLFSVFIL